METYIDIYDCTIRDGGYINNWKFPQEIIESVYNACNESKIGYCELSYIDKTNINFIKNRYSKVFSMADYKKKDELKINKRIYKNIDGIRVAAHKPEIYDTMEYIKELSNKGFITSVQMMAVTNYTLKELENLNDCIPDELDMLSIADSNGSMLPDEVKKVINSFKNRNFKLGFHSHNNMQMSLANSIAALDAGIDILDCTFNGIGRGAGNLPTELLLSYMNKYKFTDFNLNPILECIEKYIMPYKKEYKWGYDIPEMMSGIERIHPFYARDASRFNYKRMYNVLRDKGIEKPMKYKSNYDIICVIPARYESSRFPGKPLELINKKPLIYWVWKNAEESCIFKNVYIATDNKRISNTCSDYGINSIMTSSDCRTGTDRIAEVAEHINADLYINLQGDEPLITKDTIIDFVNQIINHGNIDRMVFNAITDCFNNDIKNFNVPKVVLDQFSDLLYISRHPIPYIKKDYIPNYYKQLGLYAYNKRGLELFKDYKQEILEKSEEIEFLRYVEHGIKVKMIYTKLPFKNHAIDIPEDIKIVEELMDKHGI